MTRYLVLDLETGGTDPAAHAIMSLALLTLDADLHEIDRYQTLVSDPGRAVTAEALAVNRLSVEQVRAQGLPVADALEVVRQKLDGAVPVCHNAAFDLDFLNRRGFDCRQAIDTMFLAWRAWPGQPARLGVVCQRLGIATAGGHTALGDALMTAEALRRFAGMPLKPPALEPQPVQWRWWERRRR